MIKHIDHHIHINGDSDTAEQRGNFDSDPFQLIKEMSDVRRRFNIGPSTRQRTRCNCLCFMQIQKKTLVKDPAERYVYQHM